MQPDWLPAQPTSETEWLMLPHTDVPNLGRRHRDAVADAVATLTARERDAVEAYFFERLSYSKIGRRFGMSKTHAWRLVQRAITNLKNELETHPSIRTRYNMEPTCWEDAAESVIEELDSMIRASRRYHPNDIRADTAPLAFNVRHGGTPEIVNDLWETAVGTIQQLRHDKLWNPTALHKLLCFKQHDYGHDNIASFGQVGLCVRVHDKLARYINLTNRQNAVSDETVVDTLYDIVGYAVISKMLDNDTFMLNLKDTK